MLKKFFIITTVIFITILFSEKSFSRDTKSRNIKTRSAIKRSDSDRETSETKKNRKKQPKRRSAFQNNIPNTRRGTESYTNYYNQTGYGTQQYYDPNQIISTINNKEKEKNGLHI